MGGGEVVFHRKVTERLKLCNFDAFSKNPLKCVHVFPLLLLLIYIYNLYQKDQSAGRNFLPSLNLGVDSQDFSIHLVSVSYFRIEFLELEDLEPGWVCVCVWQSCPTFSKFIVATYIYTINECNLWSFHII